MRTLRRTAAVVAVALATALPMTLAPGAEAAPPTRIDQLERGNRGVDTLAVQYLLQSRGHQVAVDGVFGPGMERAVRTFQRSRSLRVDGHVGPATWSALAPTLRPRANGPAVKAVQVLLNKKRSAGLSIDGRYGPATRAAVTTFQRHAGVSADGVVGPTTWRALVSHYAYPSWTHLCDQDPDGNGRANWGTAATVAQVEAAAAAFAATGQGRVPVGDVSLEHGGDIAGHASHELGVDVDLWPIRTDSAQCSAGRITWRSSAYDRAATRTLVKALRAKASGQIQFIYFNDPVLIREGLTRAYPNHDNHLHVRYR